MASIPLFEVFLYHRSLFWKTLEKTANGEQLPNATKTLPKQNITNIMLSHADMSLSSVQQALSNPPTTKDQNVPQMLQSNVSLVDTTSTKHGMYLHYASVHELHINEAEVTQTFLKSGCECTQNPKNVGCKRHPAWMSIKNKLQEADSCSLSAGVRHMRTANISFPYRWRFKYHSNNKH